MKKTINKGDWSGETTEITINEKRCTVRIAELKEEGPFVLKAMSNNNDLYIGYYITNEHWTDSLGSVIRFRGDKEWFATACGIERTSECVFTAVAQLLLNTI